MEFTKEEKLPGLKLYLEEDSLVTRRWFLFEEDVFIDKLEGNGNKIVASITINWDERTIDFHVNNHILPFYRGVNEGKGYGALILSYIENEMLPDFPSDFKITNKDLYGKDHFLMFKKHIEEKIRASLNVLVIGVDESLIQTLQSFGYKKIYNIKSYIAALTFLEEHVDLASHIHLVFLKNFSKPDFINLLREHLDKIFSYYSQEYDAYLLTPTPKEEVHYHYWDSAFPRICFYSDPFSQSEMKEEIAYYQDYKRIISDYNTYISSIEKRLFPLLRVGHLKKERLPIFIPQAKIRKIKTVNDLRILCLSPGENFSYYKEYLQQRGIDCVTFFQDHNFSYVRNALHQLGDYDIVIAEDGFSYTLLANFVEAKEQARICGRDTTMLAIYSASSVYNGISQENHVFYSILDHDEVIKKHYSFSMVYDDSSKENNHYDFEFVFLRIIETIIREYISYLNEKGEKITCEQFSSYQQLDTIYQELLQERWKTNLLKQEEEIKRKEFYKGFDTLRKHLLQYVREKNKYNLDKIEEVSIEEQEDYICVSFLFQGMVRGVAHIPKREQKNGRIFTIQTLGKSGTLLPATFVCLRYKEDEGDLSIPSLTEKQMQLFQGICKRVETYVVPALSNAAKKSYVPRKKKKSCYNEKRRDDYV